MSARRRFMVDSGRTARSRPASERSSGAGRPARDAGRGHHGSSRTRRGIATLRGSGRFPRSPPLPCTPLSSPCLTSLAWLILSLALRCRPPRSPTRRAGVTGSASPLRRPSPRPRRSSRSRHARRQHADPRGPGRTLAAGRDAGTSATTTPSSATPSAGSRSVTWTAGRAIRVPHNWNGQDTHAEPLVGRLVPQGVQAPARGARGRHFWKVRFEGSNHRDQCGSTARKIGGVTAGYFPFEADARRACAAAATRWW